MNEQRHILLVPFPFSDQTGQKIRPVLVVSNNEYNKGKDLVVCGVTSSIKEEKYRLTIGNSDMESGNLFSKSSIKADSILKIDKMLIIKEIGLIKKTTFAKVLDKIHLLLR